MAGLFLFMEMQATPVFYCYKLGSIYGASVMLLFYSSNSSGIVLVLMLYMSVQDTPFFLNELLHPMKIR